MDKELSVIKMDFYMDSVTSPTIKRVWKSIRKELMDGRNNRNKINNKHMDAIAELGQVWEKSIYIQGMQIPTILSSAILKVIIQ